MSRARSKRLVPARARLFWRKFVYSRRSLIREYYHRTEAPIGIRSQAMLPKLSLFITISLGCAGLLVAQPGAFSDEPTTPKGVEVLARGPIHEAFAEPVDGNP